MGTAGWICVSAIGVVVVVYLILAFVIGPIAGRKQEDKEQRIRDKGQLVKCWIVMADDQLWKGLTPGDAHGCHVVFTTTPDVPELDARLEEMADRLRTFDAGENPTEDERITAQVMTTEIGYFKPLRLPERVAGDLEAYNVSVMLRHKQLPEGRLRGPYINCKVVLEGEDAGAAYVESPAGG